MNDTRMPFLKYKRIGMITKSDPMVISKYWSDVRNIRMHAIVKIKKLFLSPDLSFRSNKL
jgi:hypothetical protein